METIAIIINLRARQAKNFQAYVDLLKPQFDCKLFLSQPHDLPISIKNCKKKFKKILVGGGDGTIRTAAQYFKNTDIMLGVLPLGTLNHFAQENNLPFSPEEIADALNKNSTKSVDLAEVNGNIFINNASLGFYPGLVQVRNYYEKFINKWLAYIPSFFSHFFRFKPLQLTLKFDKKELNFRTSFLLISNNAYSIDFPTSLKRETLEEGTLGMYYNISETKYAKNHQISPQLLTIDKTNNQIRVNSNSNTLKIALDGEVMKLKTPLVYKSLPKSLNILTKP